MEVSATVDAGANLVLERARQVAWRGGPPREPWIVAESSPPRGAVVTNGGGRPSSLRRRSGGVKLEAAVLGDHRERWEQPRQSRAD
jgi:hypothetical protein